MDPIFEILCVTVIKIENLSETKLNNPPNMNNIHEFVSPYNSYFIMRSEGSGLWLTNCVRSVCDYLIITLLQVNTITFVFAPLKPA